MSDLKDKAAHAVKRAAALCGMAALLVLATLAIGNRQAPAIARAGSGDAPTHTTYIQPTVVGISMGATATATTPPTIEAITVASPTVKAGS